MHERAPSSPSGTRILSTRSLRWCGAKRVVYIVYDRITNYVWETSEYATYRKLPVKSLTPGFRTVSARKLAPLDTSLRLKSQPCTPPGFDSEAWGVEVDRYRVPVTMSKLWAFCKRINWGMNLGFRKNIRRAAQYADIWSYVMREVCVHDDHKVSSDEV